MLCSPLCALPGFAVLPASSSDKGLSGLYFWGVFLFLGPRALESLEFHLLCVLSCLVPVYLSPFGFTVLLWHHLTGSCAAAGGSLWFPLLLLFVFVGLTLKPGARQALTAPSPSAPCHVCCTDCSFTVNLYFYKAKFLPKYQPHRFFIYNLLLRRTL